MATALDLGRDRWPTSLPGSSSSPSATNGCAAVDPDDDRRHDRAQPDHPQSRRRPNGRLTRAAAARSSPATSRSSRPTGTSCIRTWSSSCGEISGTRQPRSRRRSIVVEVLSESTAERDHGHKRWAYQKIPSLKHYLLIDQNEPASEVATRADDGSWRSVHSRGARTRVCDWTRSVSSSASPRSSRGSRFTPPLLPGGGRRLAALRLKPCPAGKSRLDR